MTNKYFNSIPTINYNKKSNKDSLSYKFYDPKKIIGNKTMEEHLRIAICYWHNFCWDGNDSFGKETRDFPWKSKNPVIESFNKVDAMFEFVKKLNVPYFTFHDVDIAPYEKDINKFILGFYKVVEYMEKIMHKTKINLLWGTANLFSHKRYLAGAATNPDPDVFACAAVQTKKNKKKKK
jgi:xylose isomerase